MVLGVTERYLEMFRYNMKAENYFDAYEILRACLEIAGGIRVLDIIILRKYFSDDKRALAKISTAVRLAEESKITLEGKAS